MSRALGVGVPNDAAGAAVAAAGGARLTATELAEALRAFDEARAAYLYSRSGAEEVATRAALETAHERVRALAVGHDNRDWVENGPRAADLFCPLCAKQGFGLMRGATYQRRCRACGYEAAHKPLNIEPASLERAAAGVTSWA